MKPLLLVPLYKGGGLSGVTSITLARCPLLSFLWELKRSVGAVPCQKHDVPYQKISSLSTAVTDKLKSKSAYSRGERELVGQQSVETLLGSVSPTRGSTSIEVTF
jgi:hypothetical protein